MQKVWEEIKERLKVEDIVGEYVSLKPAGRNLRGLCPFHHEKTPSFMVSMDRGIWHCFGCGEGGDIFAFVKKIEGIEFGDALKILAKKAGVTLTREDPKVTSKRTKLIDVIDATVTYYHKEFVDSTGALHAREYMYKKRGFTKETIDTWDIGYSHEAWSDGYEYLKAKGFSEQDIYDAGITLQKTKGTGYYDRFRDRIMFPIHDQHGLTVGFGGRLLQEKENEGKYINSPQTPIYNKSEVVFGLDKAKDSIRKEKYVVLVEGYMDCIASHQAGITNVVASSGTALTHGQLTLLKRYTDTLVLAFDVDLAGELALKRSLESAFTLGFSVEVVSLSGVKDPDELIRKDPKEWMMVLENRVSVIDYFVERMLNVSQKDKGAQVKKEIMDELAPLLTHLNDPVERAHYFERIGSQLGVPAHAIQERVALAKPSSRIATPPVPQKSVPLPPVDGQAVKMAARLLSLTLLFPHYMEDIQKEWFPSHELRALWDVLHEEGIQKFMKRTDLWSQRLMFLKESQEEAMPMHELEEEFFKARTYLWQQYLKNEQRTLMNALKEGINLSSKERETLMGKLKLLHQELYKSTHLQ